jgi:hypothetical protein
MTRRFPNDATLKNRQSCIFPNARRRAGTKKPLEKMSAHLYFVCGVTGDPTPSLSPFGRVNRTRQLDSIPSPPNDRDASMNPTIKSAVKSPEESDWDLMSKDVAGLHKMLELQAELLADLGKRVEQLRPDSTNAENRRKRSRKRN